MYIMLYIVLICLYTQALLLCLIKAWERTIKKRELGKHNRIKWEHWMWNRKSDTS